MEHKGDETSPLSRLAHETHRVEQSEPSLHARHGAGPTTGGGGGGDHLLVCPLAVGASVGGEVLDLLFGGGHSSPPLHVLLPRVPCALEGVEEGAGHIQKQLVGSCVGGEGEGDCN